MIKLFATDLDGTLVDHNGHIAEEDIIALRRARDLGVIVVVATGRIPSTIDAFLDRLEVREEEPVVGAQGAIIARRNGEIIHALTIPREVAHEASLVAHELDAVPVFYTVHEILMERVCFSPEEDVYWLGRGLRYDADALAHLDEDIIKVLVAQPDVARAGDVVTALRKRIGGRAEVVQSHHWFIEVVNTEASKGAAIAWIAAQLGIRQDEVLAIGDAANDVSMLQWAGHSVATGDAVAEAKAAADWIAPPLAEHPVAAALERYLFVTTKVASSYFDDAQSIKRDILGHK